METLEQKIARVLKDHVALVAYDPDWPRQFEEEKAHLFACLPKGHLKRIEHYGSTSIVGMAAKPIVDMLVEVEDLEATRSVVPPILEAQGYDYFWRPLGENDGPPHYCWFIKRDNRGRRTHHIHMGAPDVIVREGLLFREYLRANPDVAAEYLALKQQLSRQFPSDRIAYTHGKSAFVQRVLSMAEKSQVLEK